MRVKHLKVGAFAGALLAAVLFSSPVAANTGSEPGFAALQNVEVQSLTAAEMEAIAGELNAAQIAAGLFAVADRLAAFPRLARFYNALAAATLANAARINATLARFHLLTD